MKEVENDISGTCTLIKRLTKSERAFVTKKLSASKGNTFHQELFDVILKTNSYEEAEIKKQFTATAIAANYTLVKSQLLELVLKYLSELDISRSMEGQLFRKLESAAILGRKMLRPQAIKLINSVVKEAEKYDYYALQLKAYELLIEFTTKLMAFEEIGETVYGVNKLLHRQKLYIDTLDLTHRANFIFFTSNAKTGFRDKLAEIRSKIVPIEHDSLKVKSAFNHLQGFIYMIYAGDYKQAATFFDANIHLLEQNPDYLETHVNIYKTAAYNLAICCDTIDDDTRFFSTIEKIIAFDNKNGFEDAESFGQVLVLKQSFLQKREKHHEVIRLIEEHEARILQHELQMPPGIKIVLYTNFTISFVTMKEWKKALKWNNYIINETYTVSNDLVCFNRMMNLIIHYELGNIELIESILPNLLRYLVARDYYNSTFKILFDFFQEYCKDYTKEKESLLLKQLKETIKNNPVEDHFNMQEVTALILDWAEKKTV